MAMLVQIDAEPPLVCSETLCMPEISAIILSRSQMSPRMPCTVPSSWSGCRSASGVLRISASFTFGEYFMVQVPCPTSMLRSAPRFSWLNRR